MERDDMIRRLDAGEKAIDLSIEKFEDMFDDTGYDDGGDNCACCYVDDFHGCQTCPIYKYEEEEQIKGRLCNNLRLCSNLPDETDKVGIKEVIEYLKRVKQWMIEKGEY